MRDHFLKNARKKDPNDSKQQQIRGKPARIWDSCTHLLMVHCEADLHAYIHGCTGALMHQATLERIGGDLNSYEGSRIYGSACGQVRQNLHIVRQRRACERAVLAAMLAMLFAAVALLGLAAVSSLGLAEKVRDQFDILNEHRVCEYVLSVFQSVFVNPCISEFERRVYVHVLYFGVCV
jgi:hypothetical protein